MLHLPSIQLLLVDPLCDLLDSLPLGSSSPTHINLDSSLLITSIFFQEIITIIEVYAWTSLNLQTSQQFNKQRDICFLFNIFKLRNMDDLAKYVRV